MNYFKNTNNEIFAYDNEQVAQGHSNGLTAITEEEKEAILAPTAEELETKALVEAKQAKQLALDSIVVTTASGKVFDGRDKDQVRMLSAIQASTLLGLTTAQWKLADDSIVEITLDELKEAQALAIQAMGAIILGV